jgi:maltokinase
MPSTAESLAPWIARQRWYSGKGTAPRLRMLAALPVPSTDPSASIQLLLVADDADERIPVYQVPVLERAGVDPERAGYAIGPSDSGGTLYDAPHDPAFSVSLLEAMTGGAADLGDAPIRGSGVLMGEQSNTSIVVGREGAVDLVIKVFRVVHHGDNPDAELQSVLSAAGIPFVPRFFGEVVGEWTDGHDESGTGHLAVVQEFITGAEDAWRIALRAAADLRPFTEEARALGRATATMHETLAVRMDTREPSIGDTVSMAAIWHSRLGTALRDAPALEPLRLEIESVYDAAQEEVWPVLQRIHGDLHLGQILHAPDGRWVFIDFEGEPLRTMSERSKPEPALRDVAGMLRSFDYAAASGDPAVTSGGEPSPGSRAWAEDCRTAFLEGYSEVSTSDPLAHRELLDALELDKAVYEVSYESRNRPAWIGIPLRAVARLVHARF